MEQALAEPHAVPVQLCVVLPPGHAADDVASMATVVTDEDRQLHVTYGARRPTWYLVRPDGHIAAARDFKYAGEFAQVLRMCADALPGADAAHAYASTSLTERELISLTIQ